MVVDKFELIFIFNVVLLSGYLTWKAPLTKSNQFFGLSPSLNFPTLDTNSKPEVTFFLLQTKSKCTEELFKLKPSFPEF